MYKYLLPLLILTSCQSKINNPAQNIPDGIQNLPQFSDKLSGEKEIIPNKIIKGEFWKVEVSPEWKQTSPGGALFLLFTRDETSTASLQKVEFAGDLVSFSDMVLGKIISTGADASIKRQFHFNNRNIIEIETIMDGGIDWSWVSIFGGEGYVLTCGGEITKFDKNRTLCLELLNKFYIGIAP